MKLEYTDQQPTKQPPYLYVLCLAELADRFQYYGLQALIVLYLTKTFKFSDASAYSLYGIFTALCFAITIVGGLIGDKVIGYYRSVIIGFVLLIAANVCLSLSTLQGIYLGLALTITGIGLFKSNAASYVGRLYTQEDPRREGGYSIFYIGMNAGSLLGPIVYGFIAVHYGWKYAFIVSAIILAITMGIFVLSKSIFMRMRILHSSKTMSIENQTGTASKYSYLTYIAIPIAVVGIMWFLKWDKWFDNFIEAIGLVVVFAILWLAFRSKHVERKQILALCVIIFFCIFFFSCSLQTATSLTIFIERQVDRSFLGWQIPTMMFLSLQPLFVIITAPTISKLWTFLKTNKCDLSYGAKIAVGLLFAASSFFVFSLAAHCIKLPYHISLWGIVIGNLLLALGELCVLPVALSAISQFAPNKWQSTFMGVLFLALSFSSYFSGLIAKIISISKVESIDQISINYTIPFLDIGLITLAISLIMFAINIWIKPFLQGNRV
jgi:POT family proton-dependent oligopeptide transporter